MGHFRMTAELPMPWRKLGVKVEQFASFTKVERSIDQSLLLRFYLRTLHRYLLGQMPFR